MRLSVNLSARQLREANLAETVRAALARHQPPPESIELELTESMLMRDSENHLKQLHLLRAEGVALSIDDFGTGYSSLAYLGRFPIDKLKIDRSFVLQMSEGAAGRAVITAIVHLGHALGLQVVAEGVETESQAQQLREAACDELQGFGIARPMPAAQFEAWARAQHAAVQATVQYR